ncbi:hypothetical protein H2200_003839 [Cladophialophora chaetospira]|uniref:N-acetyl-D-glucosamine kinase n=1 Tax=Cladophialophora chaetospira TaxID=386627 RepID=A0AA38XF35_9EURO|nr:hypothetical protein H2200_003839 [Cladophialophora chaetospira]
MAALKDLSKLQTEQRNSASSDIDRVSTVELCNIINDEDAAVAASVAKCIPTIAAAIDCLADRARAGGRVIYVGAGTSGRLGVLDASEIPPTFSSPEGQFIGIIAGGEAAIRHAQEGAEDDTAAAVRDLEVLQLDASVDSLIGIAASGRTPYVLSCLSFAKSLGCATIGVACTEPSTMAGSGHVDFMIAPVVGPEVVTGSTRMKAGTATKLVLNMLSTGTMIRTGKTYGNMMVDLKATNLKLEQRSRNILRTTCGIRCPESDNDLDALLKSCHGSVKVAIATLNLRVSPPEAKRRLDEVGGVLANLFKDKVEVSPRLGKIEGYVLCVDGGGSKCAAAIVSCDGPAGYGEASSCNVTDIGVGPAIEAISTAIQRACETLENLKGKPWRPAHFSSVWIALAGHDREAIAMSVDTALEKLFKRRQGPGLKITNDIELLAISAAEKGGAESVLVLVAGTGSVAMSFKHQGSRFVRVGRSGGWGHLLGDEGSGFDIGRQAVRRALAELDQFNNAPTSKQEMTLQPLSHISRLVLDHFRPAAVATQHFDLLSAALSATTETERKKRIAGVARLVIEASETDAEAGLMVMNAALALVDLTKLLVNSTCIDSRTSTLVIGGGLMRSEVFSRAVKKALHDIGPVFQRVEVVANPAMSGAEYLSRELQG